MTDPDTTADAPEDLSRDPQRVLAELALDSAGVGTFDWDLTTGRLAWDDRLVEQFGYDREDFDETIEAFNARVHPEDLPRVAAALETAIATGGMLEVEYRIVLPDGVRHLSARGRALVGPSGASERLLGATLDVTATRTAETAVSAVLEAMNAAFFSLDREWRFTYVNAEAERLLQRPRAELLGGVLWELFPAAPGSDFERHYRGAAESGRMASFDAHYPSPLDSWYEVRALPTADGLSVYFHDITDRRRAQAAAEDAARRAALVARVTSQLAGHLDAESAVADLARLVVPDLADWCLVTVVDDDATARSTGGGLHDVGTWHADPDQRALVEEYARLRLEALSPQAFVLRALSSAEPVLVQSGGTAALVRVLGTDRARELAERLGPESFAVFPLRGRGRTVGLLPVFRGPRRSPMEPDEVATAAEVAGRAGLALDNSRLYRQQRDLAEGLQRSLLTEPPEPDHAEVVVRYAPAAETAQVGGDWYDAFLQHEGSTVLVIGDVVGHDTQAAAAMSQVRTILRTTAVVTGDGPAGVLREVDRTMALLQVGTTATAVVARIERHPEPEAAARGTTVLRWSNAGHPPPMVVDPDGAVRELARPEADLLLGVVPGAERHEDAVVLERGSVVVLYTDGLVERRDQPLDVGLEALRERLQELSAEGLPLQQLCDRLLAAMLPERPQDDVALVAVRLHPEDRPRPPEAGRGRVPPGVPAPDHGTRGTRGTR